MDIILKPIGQVVNSVDNKEHRGWKEVVSEIVLDKEYRPALDGLGDFSHVFVFFWLHQVTSEERATKRARPLRKAEIPELGIFAWHSSRRPNPIGMTIVKILGVETDRVRVVGLDAIDGTPVLDLKPFIAGYYRVDNSKEPAWVATALAAREQAGE